MGTPIRPQASDDPLGLFSDDTTATPAASAAPAPGSGDPLGLFGSAAQPVSEGAALAAQEAPPGKLTSLLAGANVGAMPFSDELMAGASALMTGHPIDNYQKNLDYIRAKNQAAQTANPKTFVTGELGGAVVSPVTKALGAGEAPLTLGGRVLQGARVGALGGAVYGAGAAEGGLGARAQGAVVGGGVGGVLGAALPVAGAVGGTALDVLHLRPKVPIKMAPAVDRARAALQPRSGTGGLTGGAGGTAGARTGSIDFAPLGRAAAGAYGVLGPRSTAEVADELLLGAARKAGVPLTAAADATRAAGGAPLTAMELFGVPGQRLGQASRGISSGADETITTALEARHAGQPERILGAMERGLGQEGRGDFYNTIDDLMEHQDEISAPLYQKALSAPPIPQSASMEIKGKAVSLADLLKRPALQKALGHARNVAAERGETPPALNPDGTISVDAVNSIKKSLDSMLRFGKTRGTLPDGSAADDESLRAINDTRLALLKIVDNEVPDYKAARDAFAGDAALRDALESGRAAFGKKLDHRLVAHEMADLSKSEQEMYRQGALEAQQQRMESAGSGANKVLKVFDTPADKARLRALFPDNKAGEDAFNAFTSEMEREAQMAGTRNAVLKGSQTAEKLGAQQELQDDAISTFLKGIGSPLKTTVNFLDRRHRVQTRAVADALAPRLTQGATPMSGTLADLLSGLTEAEKRIARRGAARQAVVTSAGATAGGSVAKP